MPEILSSLSILFMKYTLRDLDNLNVLLYKLFRSVPGCQTCMCKRGVRNDISPKLIIERSKKIFTLCEALVFSSVPLSL